MSYEEGTVVHTPPISFGRWNPEYQFSWSRDEKYVAHVLPLPRPVLMADLANQLQGAVLGAWKELHSPFNAVF